MKLNANTILWIALIVLAILYLRSCDQEGSTETQYVTVSDTTYIQGKSDTVFLVDTLVKYKYLTSTVIETITDTISGDTIRTYQTEVDDSLLTAEIKSLVKGELINVSFNYRPKFPQYITRVDTVQIEDSTIVTPHQSSDRWGLLFGGVAGGNATSFEISPTLMLKTPKGMQFSVGYGVINKTYNIGVFTKIPNPFE
jgi:hypothetical protein